MYAEIIECMRNRYIFSKIGIAIPGPFDYKNAKSLMTHKFKSIYGLDMRNELKKIQKMTARVSSPPAWSFDG